MTTANEDRTYSLAEAAERIGAPSEDWLLRKLRARKLPGRRITRGVWRMTECDITESIHLLASPALVVPNPLSMTPGSRRRLGKRSA
ncbi:MULTISPECIES: hypothetical protein [unclassified Nocardia]|uniref:hypothetical protein n=1 Tax=unclassified Nocardia TaxID=2637762 RepID=UPI00278BF3BD|nr:MULTISPECIES: hypothetical protein [unclassified Nocardia]